MGIPKINQDRFSYSDYLTWKDEERWEIIDGFPYNMSPAPNRKHQSISGNFFASFHNYFKGKKCKVFAAPFDVRLAEKKQSNDETYNVVQPDISIICDESKLDLKGAIAAPDLIVEILSESTANKDLNIKLLLYQEFGVKEYWIADPNKNTLNVYFLDSKGRYKLIKIYQETDKIKPILFPDLEIDLMQIFED